MKHKDYELDPGPVAVVQWRRQGGTGSLLARLELHPAGQHRLQLLPAVQGHYLISQ